MRTVELQKREVNVKELVKKTALEADTEKVIAEPGVFTCGGRFVAAYGAFRERHDDVVWAVDSLKYDTGKRTLGLKSTSRIFGFSPRLTIRRDYCSSTRMATEMPTQHGIICEFGKLLDSLYRELAPNEYGVHSASLHSVGMEWRIPGTLFTSGIVNKTNQLKYHFDRGNFRGVCSAMAVFRRGVEGGFLSLPEYGVRFSLRDHSYFIFDGQAILHGVTPMKTLNSKSYRYSLVYYALEQMKHCRSCREEIARIRIKKREREKRRLQYASSNS